MEDTISSDEHVRRLMEYVQSIAGDTPIEEYLDFIDDDEGLEGVSTKNIKQATDAAVRGLRGKRPSRDGLYHLEAIVHKKDRPSHVVRGDKFSAFPGEFKYLTSNRTTRERLTKTFSAIGRIDITDQNTYGGTGFVVGKNLVMTNRHVAQLFTSGVGIRHVKLKPWGSEIDFRENPSYETADGYELTKCVMIHPYWDMALFEADLPNIKPLTLSVDSYAQLRRRKQDVVVIGYPARDTRNGLKAQQDIFGDDFEVKRIAPGRISNRKRKIRSKWLSSSVDALAHDASTLGGNSGSAIIDVEKGTVAALHFAGRYLVENYGVPGYELARDPRVVDAGVTFASTVNDTNKQLNPYWADTEFVTPNNNISSPDHSDLSTNQGIQMKTNQDNVTIEVPLRVTISLGRPHDANMYDSGLDQGDDDNKAADPGASDDDGAGDDFDIGESRGSGYDKNFLSTTVPTPKLTKKIAKDSFEHNGSKLIHYTHFSICQSKSRTLPRFVAWNIDGGRMKQLSRKGIRFIRDRRVPVEFQAGNELYKNNDYDRGHVARRADLNWGPLDEAKAANRDSFFFTNMTPQHAEFNQSSKGGLWGELENAIFADVNVDDLKVSVMAGPIFRKCDKTYRDVQIPEDFWKLIAWHDRDADEFKVAAYIISQKELVFTEGQQLDKFHLYQVSLGKLAKETKLNFDRIAKLTSASDESEYLSHFGIREISGRDGLTW